MARVKKEDEFYTLLKEFAALIVETSEEYAGIVHDFPHSMSRIPQMKVFETNCDERVKTIMGAGAAKDVRSVNWGVCKEMVLTWIFTFPGCGLIGFVLAKLFLVIF